MNIANDCTEKDMKIVKGHLPDYSHTYTTDMEDDVRLDYDLSLYGVYGIPQKI